jgi:hypothetical protein
MCTLPALLRAKQAAQFPRGTTSALLRTTAPSRNPGEFFFFRTALISGESCCRTHPCLHVVSLTLHLANAVDTPNDVADSSSDSTPYVVGSDSIVPTRVRSRGRHMLYHPLRCRVVGCTFGSTESKPMRKDHMRQHIRNMHTKVGKTD